jgi:hypothetical protein
MTNVNPMALAVPLRAFLLAATALASGVPSFALAQSEPTGSGRSEIIITKENATIDPSRNRWFVVGQGELTLGTSSTTGPATAVSGDPLVNGDYLAGRAAFYAKGVIGSDVKITASLDTGEALVADLFSNLDRKDPRQLLRRLRSTQYYPTYGDDSTLVEDAPTQGRFYLRVQKQASQLVIGNFSTAITGTDLAQLDRGLFGALVDVNSNAVTSFGERKAQITAFASDPGTIPGRDEFRGTGGSLYFLKHQDLSVGSERVRIEIRDQTSGLVLKTRELHAQEDYDFDPFQGRLSLLRPLSSIAATGNTVRDGSSDGNVPVLVVRYEYTPAVGDLSGYTLGGRVAGWLGNVLRFGATAQRDTNQDANQTLFGSDILVRYASGTYIKAELARTKGAGFGQSNSVDGGLNFSDFASPGAVNQTAQAWRTEFAIDVAELRGRSGHEGTATGYFERADAGFSALGHLSPDSTERWGFSAALPLTSTASVALKADQLTTAGIGQNRTATLDLTQRFGGGFSAKFGVRNDVRARGLLYNSSQSGTRTDAAAQLTYAPEGAALSFYGFGQMTVDRDASRTANNRAGIGATAQIGKHTSLSAEVLDGSGGVGANIQINRNPSKGAETYLGYALLADQTDRALEPQSLFTRNNNGSLIIGARKRYGDSWSVNAEQRIGIGGTAPSLVRQYGLKFEPTAAFSVTGSLETGRIDDATTGVFRRTAATLGLGYAKNGFRVGSSVEARYESGSPARTQRVWLFRNTLDYGINPDWRFLGRLNFAIANGTQANVTNADYVEGIVGFAYRPVRHERLNALARITYFQDLGPVGQISGSGRAQSPKQISRIVSLDANYDLSSAITVGAKYGYRSGSVSQGRDSNSFVSSDAHLGIVRVDYRVARKWDALVEGRILSVSASHDQRLGALGAVYRHVNNAVKLGIGYSLCDFSDDLTDQSYSSHGPFLNLVGKF